MLRSDIVLSNPSATETASGIARFYHRNGSPFSTDITREGITDSVEFSVLPLDSVAISTTGQGDLGAGTAVVVSNPPLAGVIRFDIDAPPGIGSGIAGVPASEVLSGFVTPVRRIVDGINTGVAIRNVRSDVVTVNLSLRSQDGVEVPDGLTTRTIFGDAQFVEGIDELFPTVFVNPPEGPESFVGSLVVTSDGMIAATALEQGVNPGEFTTLPVTPLVSVPANGPPSVVAFSEQPSYSINQLVNLTATAVDPDGDPILEFTVVQVEGPLVSFSTMPSGEGTSLTIAFTAPVVADDETLVFRFTATDGEKLGSRKVGVLIRGPEH